MLASQGLSQLAFALEDRPLAQALDGWRGAGAAGDAVGVLAVGTEELDRLVLAHGTDLGVAVRTGHWAFGGGVGGAPHGVESLRVVPARRSGGAHGRFVLGRHAGERSAQCPS